MLADTVQLVEGYYAQFVPAARDAVQGKMDSGVGIEEQAKFAAQRGKRLWACEVVKNISSEIRRELAVLQFPR